MRIMIVTTIGVIVINMTIYVAIIGMHRHKTPFVSLKFLRNNFI